jgi:hypothetical protein
MLEVAHGLLDVSCCACLIRMVCQVGGTFLWLLPGCALERIGDPHVELWVANYHSAPQSVEIIKFGDPGSGR